MRQAGVCQVDAHPRLPMGAAGSGGVVPPDSRLFFEIELLRSNETTLRTRTNQMVTNQSLASFPRVGGDPQELRSTSSWRSSCSSSPGRAARLPHIALHHRHERVQVDLPRRQPPRPEVRRLLQCLRLGNTTISTRLATCTTTPFRRSTGRSRLLQEGVADLGLGKPGCKCGSCRRTACSRSPIRTTMRPRRFCKTQTTSASRIMRFAEKSNFGIDGRTRSGAGRVQRITSDMGYLGHAATYADEAAGDAHQRPLHRALEPRLHAVRAARRRGERKPLKSPERRYGHGVRAHRLR